MYTDKQIDMALHIWRDVYRSCPASGDITAQQNHLAEEALYRLAAAGGIKQAEPQELDHLTLCPQCLDDWAQWLSTLSDIAEMETQDQEDTIFSFLLQEAAATATSSEPVEILSGCGRFRLALLPDRAQKGRGLVTVDLVAGDAASLEGAHITIKDAEQKTLAEGLLHGGRLARARSDIDTFNLNSLTVVIKKMDSS